MELQQQQKIQNFQDNQDEYEKKMKEFRNKEIDNKDKIKNLKLNVLSEGVTAHIYSGFFVYDNGEEPI